MDDWEDYICTKCGGRSETCTCVTAFESYGEGDDIFWDEAIDV